MVDRPGFVGVDEYLRLPRDAQAWLLKPLIPSSGAALLYGDAKVGKSYLGIQLASALTGESPDFLGFPVAAPGNVCYLQLDTPRSVWATRVEELRKKGVKLDPRKLLLADRESIAHYPFDILNPEHVTYLHRIIQDHRPTAVIVDTLRESHGGDEDNSTVSRNVIANLVGATHPAALIIISHSRKPSPDGMKDLLADNRGSSYIVGRMDAIMRLTKKRLHYTGRSIEQGDIQLERQDSGLWLPVIDEMKFVEEFISNPQYATMREKARALAGKLGMTEEAALSKMRRLITKKESQNKTT